MDCCSRKDDLKFYLDVMTSSLERYSSTRYQQDLQRFDVIKKNYIISCGIFRDLDIDFCELLKKRGSLSVGRQRQ